MKASVRKEDCISCGVCVATCPEVFRFDDDGLAEAYQDPTAETIDAAKDARDSCPVSIIDIEE
ncbi:MAG TPA: ferredoxin [Papillibacter sp.]|jgi:ferredoxin|nr:ferredoxin [Papillibacter sp.]